MAHQNRNSNSGSRVRFNPNTGRPLGRGESTTFQGRTYREGSSNIGGTGGSSGGSNTQDPNTPRYTRETGLLTDYGRSLGLSEVSRSTRESETITSTDTTPEKPIVISPKPTERDVSNEVAGLSRTTSEEVAPSKDTQETIDTRAIAEMRALIGEPPKRENVGDDREYRRAQRGVEREKKIEQGYTDSINAIVAKSQADQLSVTGQGRGIPEAIIGGQQAQISREAAIQALPIAAQQAAAQGNLEQAQAHLENVYNIKSESLKNDYDYEMKKYDVLSGRLTKMEERQIAALKETKTNTYNEEEDFLKLKDSYAKDNLSMATRIHNTKDRTELYKLVGEIGGGKDIALTTTDKQALLGIGFTQLEISNISNDVNRYGIEKVLEGIPDEEQKMSIRKVYGKQEVKTKFITKEFLTTQFAGSTIDSMLKTLGKSRGDYAGFWKSKTTEEGNIKKDFQDYIDGIMPIIEQYRLIGYTDKEILALMK